MGLISNKISIKEVRPGKKLKSGDHIYSWRNKLQTYAHHGIYVGDGVVIHFTRPRTKPEIALGNIIRSLRGILPCPTCGDISRLSGVISSCLDCFLDGDNLYRYEYEYNVNHVAFVAKTIGGTCTLASSDPLEDVLYPAKYLLSSRDGFGVYKLLKNNCENFALYCKTGLLVSKKTGQANSVSTASGAAYVFAVAGRLWYLLLSTTPQNHSRLQEYGQL